MASPKTNSTSSSTASPHTYHHLRGDFGTEPLRDSLSFLVTLVVGAAASASGVGGGAIYVPLLDVVEGLGPRAATATSQVAVAAGSVAAIAMRWGRRHPADPNRPIVDWQMAAVLQPPLLLGVSAGLVANHALPSWAITFALIIFLSLMALDTCLRATRLHRRETQAREEAIRVAMEEAEAQGERRKNAEAEAQEEGAAGARVAEAAAAGTGAATTTATTAAASRPETPSSSSYAMSMASLGTGSFLEDIFSAGVSRIAVASPANALERRTQSTSSIRSRPASRPTAAAAGDFPRRSGEGTSGESAGPPLPTSKSAAAAAFRGPARRAFTMFPHSRWNDATAAAAAAVAAVEARGDEAAGKEQLQNDLRPEGGCGDEKDDSSLDLALGSSEGGGSGSRHSSLRREGGVRRAATATPPPSAAPSSLLFPRPHSPRTEGTRTAASSPVQALAPPRRPSVGLPPPSPPPAKATKATETMTTETTTTETATKEEARPVPPAPPPPPRRSRRVFSFLSPRALASNGAAAAQLVLLFAAMTALQVVRSLAPTCSRKWVAATAAQAGVAALATAASIVSALAAAARGDTLPASAADAAAAELVYGAEPERTAGRLLVAAAVALVAGVFAAVLGIGGGMVVVPLLLALRVHPQCAAATSTVLILFSSTAAAAGQGAAGYVVGSFAAAFGAAALVAGVAGVWLSSRYVDRSGRSSILVWMLAAIVAGGAVATASLGGIKAAREIRSEGSRVRRFCAA